MKNAIKIPLSCIFLILALAGHSMEAGAFARLLPKLRSAAAQSKTHRILLGATTIGAAIGIAPTQKKLRWHILEKPYATLLARQCTAQDGEYECPDEIVLHTRHGGKMGENNYGDRSEDKAEFKIPCPPGKDMRITRKWGTFYTGNGVVSYVNMSDLSFTAVEDIIDVSLKYPTYFQHFKNWYYNITPPTRGKLRIVSNTDSIYRATGLMKDK